MVKNTIVAALAAAAFALYPILGSGHGVGGVRGASVASAAPACVNGATPVGSATLGTAAPGPLTFPTGCYGGSTRCTGTLVGVYGSSALKSYINNVATDYCTAQQLAGTTGANAIDVEYLGGGDSCPGDNWAANNTDGAELGVSDVFAGACATEGQGVTGAISDSVQSVNVVNALATCPGATRPQGNALNGGGATPCQGNGSGAAGSATFCAPGTLSNNAALNLFVGGGNFKNYGGCDNGSAQVQERQSGSGTRVTWCFNVFGAGNGDKCNNTASQVPATGTADMLNDVCGTIGGGPLDNGPAIGYATRAAVVKDPRLGTPTVLGGCGLVAFQGTTGYNQDCAPATATAGSPNVGTNPGDGAVECLGDRQVSTGAYTAWGYEHLVVHASSDNPNNAAALSFLQYAFNTPSEDQTQVQSNGFMRLCQMQFSRTLDAGPYVGATPTC